MILVRKWWAENSESSGLKQKVQNFDFWLILKRVVWQKNNLFVCLLLRTQLGIWDRSQHLPDENRKTCKSGSNYVCSERLVSTCFNYGTVPSWKVLVLNIPRFQVLFCQLIHMQRIYSTDHFLLDRRVASGRSASDYRMRRVGRGNNVKGARRRLAVAITSKMPTKNSPALQHMLEITLSSPDSLRMAAKHVVNYMYLAPRNVNNFAANVVP